MSLHDTNENPLQGKLYFNGLQFKKISNAKEKKKRFTDKKGALGIEHDLFLEQKM